MTETTEMDENFTRMKRQRGQSTEIWKMPGIPGNDKNN